MPDAVVVDAVRTPIGSCHPEKGLDEEVRADDLAVPGVHSLLARTRLGQGFAPVFTRE